MAVIKGKDGTVALTGSTAIANVTSWSVTQEADVLETSAMGTGGDKTFVGSLKSWSGSVECFLDTTAQHTSLPVGTIVDLTLDTDGAGSAGSVYSGDAVITSANVTVGAADIVTVSFDYQGTGALTIA